MSSIKLTDLISVQVLQEIQDGFADVAEMAAIIVDADGKNITKGSRLTDFGRYTRRFGAGSDKFEKYSRECGLVDISAPITIEGEAVGTFIGGQVLTEKPDETKLRRIASELGADADGYISAIKKLRVISKERADAAARFIRIAAKNISTMAGSAYQLKLNKGTVSGGSLSDSDVIKRVNNIAESCISAVSSMDEKFRQLSELADKCVSEVKTASDAAKVIQDIAMNTRILGFNASIEASRAKESGKGFGVIAQEVRSLAETSKSSADKIEDKIKSIGEFTSQIDSSAKNAAELVAEAVSGIEELKGVIAEIEA